MMRRLTIVCGMLTAGAAFAMAVQGGQPFPGPSSKTVSPVTAIPDRPVPKHVKSQWPPVKLPPRPRPEPLHHTVSAAPARPQSAPRSAASAGQTVAVVVKALLSIPKIIGQSLTNAGR